MKLFSSIWSTTTLLNTWSPHKWPWSTPLAISLCSLAQPSSLIGMPTRDQLGCPCQCAYSQLTSCPCQHACLWSTKLLLPACFSLLTKLPCQHACSWSTKLPNHRASCNWPSCLVSTLDHFLGLAFASPTSLCACLPLVCALVNWSHRMNGYKGDCHQVDLTAWASYRKNHLLLNFRQKRFGRKTTLFNGSLILISRLFVSKWWKEIFSLPRLHLFKEKVFTP